MADKVDLISKFVEFYNECRPFTMTSRDRMYCVFEQVHRIVTEQIPGDIVECGVWKGGSMMMAAIALRYFGDTGRTLWLYDTFEGMPEPGMIDYDLYERPAAKQWHQGWCMAPLQEVIVNMNRTRYPSDRIMYVTGLVQETIPRHVPDRIALLRLDTDWYESTRHELEHLYPLLSEGGALIIDDYGHWKGSQKATDEYLGPVRLLEIDYTGRLYIKPFKN